LRLSLSRDYQNLSPDRRSDGNALCRLDFATSGSHRSIDEGQKKHVGKHRDAVP
jgi:hypothetical protein